MEMQGLHCDPDTIEDFLADRLGEPARQVLEDHLERCTDCRSQLETMAAGRDWWDEARGYLSSDALLPVPVSPDLASDVPTALASVRGFLSPTDDPHMLGRLGSYEIAGVVGCGGNGVVLKAFDPALHRYVAVKVLSPSLASSGAARQRFDREARAAAAVVHENVMAIHAVSEANGLPYLVMPYVRGPSLERRLQDDGALPIEDVLRIGRQVAAGLAAAHAQGVVHRDVKPANILLEDGVARVRLTDFGLARTVDDASLTRSGVIAGTPLYMSPEQASGETVDPRSDLFSLGSVLYVMCTGRPPFRAETPYGILRRITDTEPRPMREINPNVPEWLTAIVTRLHRKAPAERFASAAEVDGLLAQCLAHLQQPAVTPLPALLAPKRSRWAPHRRWVAAAVVLIGISLTSVTAASWTSILHYLRGEAATQQQANDSSETTAVAEPTAGQRLDDARQRTTALDAELKPHGVPGYGDPADALLNELRTATTALEKDLTTP